MHVVKNDTKFAIYNIVHMHTTTGVSPRPPHHHDHYGAVHDYDDACSACSDDWKNHHYVQSNPLHCSLPALIPPHTPASYERHGAAARYMSAQDLQGKFSTSLEIASRLHHSS